MAKKTLAVSYRPLDWDSVVGQESTKIILQQQLATNSTRNSYLFVGASGCGKTTCARIFAKEINKGQGVPIEMDAASHSSVEDVREIIKMAQTKSLDSEYKVLIIDECHSLSDKSWQAFLKTIEEPPAKSIFIFCTTNPEKIPKTILNRVQRYDFKRISQDAIEDRLEYVLREEGIKKYDADAISFITRQSRGGMRDALALLDKCLGYSEEITLDNVLKALELSDTDTFLDLTDAVLDKDTKTIIEIIEDVYASGEDMKQFIKQYMNFVLDVSKYLVCEDFKYTQLPETGEMKNWLRVFGQDDLDTILDLLDKIIAIDADIKFSSSAKEYVEVQLITF